MNEAMLGLAVVVPDQCRSCGAHEAVIEDGCGPHQAGLRCTCCRRHRGRLGKRTYAFVAGIVAKFGRPATLIAI